MRSIYVPLGDTGNEQKKNINFPVSELRRRENNDLITFSGFDIAWKTESDFNLKKNRLPA